METHGTKEKYVVSKLKEIVNEFKQLFFQNIKVYMKKGVLMRRNIRQCKKSFRN